MTRRCSPSFLDVYLEYTSKQESPTRFHMWTALALVASIVRRNVFIDKYYYKLYPNLYIALIGPSAVVKKTTAANVMIPFIESVPDIFFIRGKVTSWQFFKELENLSKKKVPCAATIYASEAKHLFGDLGKVELVTMLTDLFDCPKNFTYRTIKHGVIDIHDVCINTIICSTPEWLVTGTTVDEIAGGWTGRFVYIFEEVCDRSIAFPEDFVTQRTDECKQELLDDIQDIAQAKGEFVITAQAKAEYLIWYNNRKKEWKDERLMGYYGRKPDLVWKTAMLLSLCTDNSLVIDEHTLGAAWQMLKDLELNMGRALAHVVDDPALRFKDLVLSYVVGQPGHRATRRDVLKKFWNRFDSDVLDKVMRNCEECKLIKQYPYKTANDSGIMYEVVDASNP